MRLFELHTHFVPVYDSVRTFPSYQISALYCQGWFNDDGTQGTGFLYVSNGTRVSIVFGPNIFNAPNNKRDQIASNYSAELSSAECLKMNRLI